LFIFGKEKGSPVSLRWNFGKNGNITSAIEENNEKVLK